MNPLTNLDVLDPDELRTLAAQLMAQVGKRDRELQYRQVKIDQLIHELVIHKCWEFGKRSEQLIFEQASLLDGTIDADLEAIETELEALLPSSKSETKSRPKRQTLPPQLPRADIHHEPDAETCTCGRAFKRIGEDISEKLDHTPGTFTVKRHIRGKWVYDQCETLVQTPVLPHVIDKGIPMTGLLAHTLVSKFGDHLSLYRQKHIYAHAGLVTPQSTLDTRVGICGVYLQPPVDALQEEVLSHSVLHADETPVRMLVPDSGKTHRAYLWAYASNKFEKMRAVICQLTPNRSGEHAHVFLRQQRDKLVCDDFAGYEASFDGGVTKVGCMTHSRCKFFELHDKYESELAGRALRYMVNLYGIEAQMQNAEPNQRLVARQQRAGSILKRLHAWFEEQRCRIPNGSVIARATNYSLKRWLALVRYLDDPTASINSGHVERQIRPVALGRSNWLFADSLRVGQRAAAVMGLIQSAKLSGHDPYAYLKDVLTRLPTHKAADIAKLLPHRWIPSAT